MRHLHSYVKAKLNAPLQATGSMPDNGKLTFLVEIQEQNRKLKRSLMEAERRLDSATKLIIELES
jgi:hypothetical protein